MSKTEIAIPKFYRHRLSLELGDKIPGKRYVTLGNIDQTGVNYYLTNGKVRKRMLNKIKKSQKYLDSHSDHVSLKILKIKEIFKSNGKRDVSTSPFIDKNSKTSWCSITQPNKATETKTIGLIVNHTLTDVCMSTDREVRPTEERKEEIYNNEYFIMPLKYHKGVNEREIDFIANKSFKTTLHGHERNGQLGCKKFIPITQKYKRNSCSVSTMFMRRTLIGSFKIMYYVFHLQYILSKNKLSNQSMTNTITKNIQQNFHPPKHTQRIPIVHRKTVSHLRRGIGTPCKDALVTFTDTGMANNKEYIYERPYPFCYEVSPIQARPCHVKVRRYKYEERCAPPKNMSSNVSLDYFR